VNPQRMSKFKGCRVARMSKGHYRVIRDVGTVKGGKGMRHHSELLALTPKGVQIFFMEIVSRLLPKLQAATLITRTNPRPPV
jgi:hypothetical protein